MRPALSRATLGVLLVLLLAVAGLAHGASLLALPWRSDGDAFTRVAAATAKADRATLDPGASAAPPFLDPAMLTDACRFDLRSRPFRLSLTPFGERFVTIGFHSRHGIAFYGLTVRAADASAFDLVLTDAPQAGNAPRPESDPSSVVVPAPEPEGFVTLSTPLGERSEREAAAARLAGIACRSEPAPTP